MKRIFLIIGLLLGAALVGCGKSDASFQTVEEQRAQGRSNAYVVAAEYQRQNPRIQGWEAIVKADSSHTASCPQGDGWAEVVFMRTERADGSTKNLQVEKATVMCSTVSVNEGLRDGGADEQLGQVPEEVDGWKLRAAVRSADAFAEGRGG